MGTEKINRETIEGGTPLTVCIFHLAKSTSISKEHLFVSPLDLAFPYQNDHN